ncbi:hypothetical protein [Microbacterium xylanilyticum]
MSTADEKERARRASIPKALHSQWRKAVWSKTPLKSGEYEDILGELWDWFNEIQPVVPDALTHEEAADLYESIAVEHGLMSNAEEELHRVKYLRLGADRTAEQVLEALVQQEIDTRQRREAMPA